ncbi:MULTISPECIES: phosphotransferase family protein [Sphingomonas]|uniref:Phosphotransferase family protein n=1 Tax=Sphingomonas adhaesiva TaxID=28212 RepID=A0A2A4IAG0_9SPHN|nr:MULTISPECIES: phosphotransferase family protein [Sphingomonas]PCG15499.1 phosphotransferase family protein [Sphingomonas adhaesiva]PZU80237.1 MAG: phosphotransferase family protein [Sphingomonas sp.]
MTERLDEATVAARLAALAPRLVADATGVESLRRLTGGASMATFAFDVTVGAGAAVPLILRARAVAPDPDSPPLAREAQVIAAAIAGGVPAPEVVHVCSPDDGLGEGYVMRRLIGETLGKRIATDPAFAPARDVLARQCGAALARVHTTPPPPGLDTVNAAETLARYERIWRQSGAVRPAIEAAFRWLEAHLPRVPATPRLVHGDFRNGNLMVDADRGLVAVLDWELAHIGDPAEDIGWICCNSWRFAQAHARVGGFGDLDDLLAGYVAAGGDPIEPARIDFWQMIASLKWGVMTMQMHRSFADDPAAGPERGVIGRRLSEAEADIVALLQRASRPC